MTWYDFTCAYVDMKWKPVSAKYRRAIAQALAAALPAMIEPTAGKPSSADIRRAVLDWGYNTRLRASAPDEVAAVLTWLSRNTRPVSVLRRSADARALLETVVTRLDGTRAAATSARRNRAVLFNALQHAAELGLIDANPIKDLRWTAPRASQAIDRRRVINPDQARALLGAVEAQEPSGPRLVAFFGAMYYCGLRPEEAVMLRMWRTCDCPRTKASGGRSTSRPQLRMPVRDGPIRAPSVTGAGSSTEVKARYGSSRFRLRRYGCSGPTWRRTAHLPDGHVFGGVKGGSLATITYRRVWKRAREAALNVHEYTSLLGRRPYDLRHACLSTWLNGGVAPAQVAEWAGHSVEVLLRTYARCLDGQHDIAKRRIMEALDDPARDNRQSWGGQADGDKRANGGGSCR